MQESVMIRIQDLPSDVPGKTWREKNLDTPHAIPLGALVEIVSQDRADECAGVRLYVVMHRRDCDETPLYSLAPRRGEAQTFLMHHGFPECSLRVVAGDQVAG